jgi:RNA polymerase sigma-70 factor, ECF subfamily
VRELIRTETVVPLAQPLRIVDVPTRSSQSRPMALVGRTSQRERIFGLVYRQMVSLAGRSSDLDDLVQAAAEQALRALDGFDGRSELSTWTYRICQNTYLKQHRWYRRWLNRFLFWEDSGRIEPIDRHLDQAQTIAQDERIARLWAALARLSPKRRVVVVLHDLEGLAVEQIAEIVSANPLTVRSRLRDGRAKLAAEIRMDPYFGLAACSKESQ